MQRVEDDTVNRNLNSILQALNVIAAGVTVPLLISFVSNGSNGVGSVALVPPKLPNGTVPLYRALQGMKLVAAIDLTSAVGLQTRFEQILTSSDVIRQIDSANLSGNSIVFVLQG